MGPCPKHERPPLSKTRAGDPPPVLTKIGSHPPMPVSAFPPLRMESPSEESDIRPMPGGGVPTPPWLHVPVLRFAWSLRLKSRLSGLFREGRWGPVTQHERGVSPPPLQKKSGGPPTPLSWTRGVPTPPCEPENRERSAYSPGSFPAMASATCDIVTGRVLEKGIDQPNRRQSMVAFP